MNSQQLHWGWLKTRLSRDVYARKLNRAVAKAGRGVSALTGAFWLAPHSSPWWHREMMLSLFQGHILDWTVKPGEKIPPKQWGLHRPQPRGCHRWELKSRPGEEATSGPHCWLRDSHPQCKGDLRGLVPSELGPRWASPAFLPMYVLDVISPQNYSFRFPAAAIGTVIALLQAGWTPFHSHFGGEDKGVWASHPRVGHTMLVLCPCSSVHLLARASKQIMMKKQRNFIKGGEISDTLLSLFFCPPLSSHSNQKTQKVISKRC